MANIKCSHERAIRIPKDIKTFWLFVIIYTLTHPSSCSFENFRTTQKPFPFLPSMTINLLLSSTLLCVGCSRYSNLITKKRTYSRAPHTGNEENDLRRKLHILQWWDGHDCVESDFSRTIIIKMTIKLTIKLLLNGSFYPSWHISYNFNNLSGIW